LFEPIACLCVNCILEHKMQATEESGRRNSWDSACTSLSSLSTNEAAEASEAAEAAEAAEVRDLVRPSSLPIPSFVSQELSAELWTTGLCLENHGPQIDTIGDERVASDGSGTKPMYVETGEGDLEQEPLIQSMMVQVLSEKSFTSTQCPESDKGSVSGADDEAVCADALESKPIYIQTGDAASSSSIFDYSTGHWTQTNTGPWVQTNLGKNPNWQVLKKTRLCKFFARGGHCAKGRACTFAHGQAELRLSVDFTRTSVCPTKLQHGFCTDPTCRYAHVQSELRMVEMPKTKLCSFFHGKGCMLGKACRFAHGMEELSMKRLRF